MGFKSCSALLVLILLCGCSDMPKERVDASDVMEAGRSLMIVLKGVGQGIVQGQVNLSQVKAVVPEMFDAGITTNRWLFQTLKEATNGQPLSEEAKAIIMSLAQRLEGMSAQDIINQAQNFPSDSSFDYSGALNNITNKIKRILK